MAGSSQNINTRIEGATPMARFSIGEDEEDGPSVRKRPRFSEPASQSQPQSHSQRSAHRSGSQSQSQTPVVAEQEEEEEFIAVDDEDSDSQGFEEEEEEDDEEFEAEEEEEGEDLGSDDEEEEEEEEEEEAAPAAEGNNQQQHVTVSAVATSQLGQGNRSLPSPGLQCCSTLFSVSNNTSGALQVLFTDPDVLDCPICLEPLCSPVFQCENGHIACSSCCSKLRRKCPSCCMPIGYNRCRAIEKVVESVRVACKNASFGCKEILTYGKKTEHEQVCPYAPVYCPHPSCIYAGYYKGVYVHFFSYHNAHSIPFSYNTTFSLRVTSQKFFLLQERNENVVFVLNHGSGIHGHGRLVNIDCVGPSKLQGAFVYQVVAKCADTSLSLQSVPEVRAKWSEHTPTKRYLTVPCEFLGSGGILSLNICIKKAGSAE